MFELKKFRKLEFLVNKVSSEMEEMTPIERANKVQNACITLISVLIKTSLINAELFVKQEMSLQELLISLEKIQNALDLLGSLWIMIEELHNPSRPSKAG